MPSPTGENFVTDVALNYVDAGNAEKLIATITRQLEKQGVQLSKNAKILSASVTRLKEMDVLNAKLQVGNKQVDVSGLQGQLRTRDAKGRFLPKNVSGDIGAFLVPPNLEQDTLKVTAHSKAQETLGSAIANAAKRATFTIPIWTALRFAIGGLVTNLITAGQAFIGFAIDLDKTIAKLKSVSDASENSKENIKKISDTLKDLSLSSGKGIKDLGEALFDLKRAGLSSEDSLLALEAVTNLSTGAFVDVKDSTLAVVDAINLLGPEIDKAANGVNKFNFVAGVFTALGNKSSASTEELVETFRKFVSAGSAVGLTFEQITTLTAAINQLGIRGNEGGTALTRLFLMMQQNAPVVRQLLQRDVIDPFNDFFEILKAVQNIQASQRGNVLEAIFGIRGLKGPAALSQNIDQLKDFQKLTKELLNNPTSTAGIPGKQAEDVRKNIGDLFKTLGSGLLQSLDAATKFSSTLEGAAKNTKEIADGFSKIRDFLEKTPLGLGQSAVALAKFARKNIAGRLENTFFPSPSDEETQDAIRKQEVLKRANEKNLYYQRKTEEAIIKKMQLQKEDGSFITPAIQEEINAYRREKETIEESIASVDKRAKAQNRLNNSVDDFVKRFNSLKKGTAVTSEQIFKALETGKIEEFIKSIGLDASKESEFSDAIKRIGEESNKVKQITIQDEEEIRRIKLESTLDQIEFLRTVGATEQEINKKRLEAIQDANVGWKELEQERIRQHKAELDRIREISDSLKTSFQNSLADLFKNKISPSQFATSFGDAIQNAIIDSTAKGLTNSIASTGIFAQLGLSGTALEDAFSKSGNIIIDSFTAGARAAAPILSGAISGGITGKQTGVGGLNGILGPIGGLLGGLNPNNRQVATVGGKPVTLGQTNSAVGFGNIFNAGLAGVFGAMAGAQRGTGQAIMGGLGGALTSFAPFMGALGPVGLLAGAGLTIASMFGGKKKSTEQTQEQTVQIASRIDVTNKKLDIVNRNLIALKAVFETYVLPESAYFSEARNLSDQFSLHARRGLVV